jgi:hypothetical protein
MRNGLPLLNEFQHIKQCIWQQHDWASHYLLSHIPGTCGCGCPVHDYEEHYDDAGTFVCFSYCPTVFININSRLISLFYALTGQICMWCCGEWWWWYCGYRLWGTFLADVVIRSLGTDYARVIHAIFAFAQVNVPDSTRSFSMYWETHCCPVLHKGWKCCTVYLKYNSGWLAWACRFDWHTHMVGHIQNRVIRVGPVQTISLHWHFLFGKTFGNVMYLWL